MKESSFYEDPVLKSEVHVLGPINELALNLNDIGLHLLDLFGGERRVVKVTTAAPSDDPTRVFAYFFRIGDDVREGDEVVVGQIRAIKTPKGFILRARAKNSEWENGLKESWLKILNELERQSYTLERGNDPSDDQDEKLSRLEKGIIEAVKYQRKNGFSTIDRIVAIRLADMEIQNPFGDPYSRRWINGIRNKLRDAGHDV